MSLSPTLMDEVSGAVRARLDAAGVPGAAVALIIDGQRASLGIGVRDLSRRDALDGDARFYLYSVTKMLLAIATLRLVEHGSAALDQPVREILPDLAPEPTVTLRQLLDHTAGLPDYGAMPAYADSLKADPATPWTDDEFLTRTLRTGFLFPPGQGWAYSNVGYLLVRRTIERLTGSSLRDALDQLIFAPLALCRTAIAQTLPEACVLTPGYSRDLDPDGRWHDITPRYHPGWVAHGVAISTAPDIARVLDALCSGRLLAPASLAAMRQAIDVPGHHPPFTRPGYGLGLMIDRESPLGTVAGHAGGGPGYATAGFHLTDAAGHRITAVALLNRDHANLATEIVFDLFHVASRDLP